MKLWEPETCCCCCNRRTGCIVIGILHLLSGLYNVYNSVKGLAVGLSATDINEICRNFDDGSFDCFGTIRKTIIGVYVSQLLMAILQILLSSFLLHGVLKQKTRFMIPLMVMYLLQVIMLLLVALVGIGVLMYFKVWIGVVIFIVVFGGVIFLEVYLLLVIRAYYLDIKRTKGRTHMALNEAGMEPPPYHDSKAPGSY